MKFLLDLVSLKQSLRFDFHSKYQQDPQNSAALRLHRQLRFKNSNLSDREEKFMVLIRWYLHTVNDGEIDTTPVIYSSEEDMCTFTLTTLVCMKSHTNSPVSLA